MSHSWNDPASDDPNQPPSPAKPSGTVTALALVTVILGFLQSLCSVSCLGMLALAPEILTRLQQKMESLEEAPLEDSRPIEDARKQMELFKNEVPRMIAIVSVSFGSGLLMVSGGFGLVQRRRWGRVLVLLVGFLSGVSGVWVALQGDWGNWLAGGISIAYCVWVIAVLTNDTYAAEFS